MEEDGKGDFGVPGSLDNNVLIVDNNSTVLIVMQGRIWEGVFGRTKKLRRIAAVRRRFAHPLVGVTCVFEGAVGWSGGRRKDREWRHRPSCLAGLRA